MSLGLIILLIVISGYASNRLNWRFLNYRLTRVLYYVGACVHESSHAIVCILTGAKIKEFKVFSSQPHVIHGKPKLPLIGNALISSAPIFGGLLFLFLVNRFVLGGYFSVAAGSADPPSVFRNALGFWAQLHLLAWQSWVMILLFLNVGAMIGPSWQDIKNFWPVLILLFFVQSPPLSQMCLMALSLIIVNIAIQIALIVVLKGFEILF